MENMANVLESLGEPNALSPLSTVVHDEEDFASLGHHHPGDSIVESHINSDGDDTLVPATGDDDGDSHGHIVPPSITEDDDDDNDHMGLSVAGIETETLHHEVEGLGAVVSETSDGVVNTESLEETDIQAPLAQHNLLTAQTSLGEDGGMADNVLLTTDVDGNFAMRVSTDQVIRFLLQTSDGNVVAADAQVEAVKFSMPGLVGAGDGTQTVQAFSLPDGTTFFQTQKDNSATDCPPAIVKEEPQTIKLEDGTTALLNPRDSLPEGTIQAIQLEDGTTALITPQKDGFYDAAQVNLEQFHAQTLLSVATTEKQEKSLVIGDKAYKCMYEDCGRLYTTLHHLRVHERSHTGDRPFICEYAGCGKAFATGYGLKSHNRVHTGEKPYPCPEAGCEKAFKTSGDLQKHVRTHTGERPFKCPFEGCTRSFTTSNIRKVHIRTHTGERPYICDVEGCGRAFASATNYKNHIRIHTGEKPYVCSVRGCGKAFTEYSSLYKHHVVHTHTKPYTCCYCGKTYRQTSTLAMHKRSAHGEDLPTDGGGTVDNEKIEPPVKKKLKIEIKPKIGTENQVPVPVSQGDPNQQVVLLAAPQVSQVAPSTAASTTTINNNIITTTDNISTSAPTLVAQDNQQLANIVTLQSPNGTFSLADLQQSGLHTLNLGEGQHQVLVVTDPAQLELLQQLTSHQLESAVVSQEPEGGVISGEQASTGQTALLLQ